MSQFLLDVLFASWEMLEQAAVYILFGLLVGGMLKMFLSPAYIATHLGKGRYGSVFKAALLGIPIPLCSCSVLPAAASLKKQGANNGATTAFLISTPESGVDSISISWALLDPIMTVARPIAAFLSAFVAGCVENFVHPPARHKEIKIDLSCPVDQCCDGLDCPPDVHKKHHSLLGKIRSGLYYAVTNLWADLAGWFFIGILLAGLVSVLVPDAMIAKYLGGGLGSMLLMLSFGIPLYICATASTPIAAAFIMKGVSPGTALVFLLVGPATNVTSLSVLVGLLGKRATGLYLVSIAVVSVICGLLVDFTYISFGVSAVAAVGQAAEILPSWLTLTATLLLLVLSIKPLITTIQGWFGKGDGCGCGSTCEAGHDHGLVQIQPIISDCSCDGSCENKPPEQTGKKEL